MLRAVEEGTRMSYRGRVRSVWTIAALSALLLAGCTLQPPRPSTPAERTPTPSSVSRDNPGGDAANPVDAALTRLLEHPSGYRLDKFRTINVALPDHGHWRRVRFFGHPTRASFRYGDDAYAMVVLKYFESDNNAPGVCLAKTLEAASDVAHTFDVELGEFEHELLRHARGAESVDWETREAKMHEQRAELRRRVLAWRRHRVALARKERLEALQRAARERKARQAEASKQDPTPDAVAPEAAATQPDATQPDATRPDASSSATPAASAAPAVRPIIRGPRMRAHHVARMLPLLRQRVVVPPPPPPEPPRKPRYDSSTWAWGGADMPVVRTWGQMHTLVNDDRYVAAIAAYESWPGTCLVQGFAVKVGSDEELARRVVERWLAENAPILSWSGNLRDQPRIENR
jgi:hypothetical protein